MPSCIASIHSQAVHIGQAVHIFFSLLLKIFLLSDLNETIGSINAICYIVCLSPRLTTSANKLRLKAFTRANKSKSLVVIKALGCYRPFNWNKKLFEEAQLPLQCSR